MKHLIPVLLGLFLFIQSCQEFTHSRHDKGLYVFVYWDKHGRIEGWYRYKDKASCEKHTIRVRYPVLPADDSEEELKLFLEGEQLRIPNRKCIPISEWR